MKSQFTNQQVNEVVEKRGCTRKAALRWLNRRREDRPKGKAAPAVDVKQRAANDIEFANPVDAPIVIDNPNAKKTRTVSKAVNKVQAGAARAEGLRLFTLAGRPKKGDFVKVFGKKGVAWTWEARAKALGISSAEECAEKFPSLLKKAGR